VQWRCPFGNAEVRRGLALRDGDVEGDRHAVEGIVERRHGAVPRGGEVARHRAGRAARAQHHRRMLAERIGRAGAADVAELEATIGRLGLAAGDQALLFERAVPGGPRRRSGEARKEDALLTEGRGEGPAADVAVAIRRVVLDIRRRRLRAHRERRRLRAAVGGRRDDRREGESAVITVLGIGPDRERRARLAGGDGDARGNRGERADRTGEGHRRAARRSGRAPRHRTRRGGAAAARDARRFEGK